MPRSSRGIISWSNFVVFFALYFVQGIPYGLQTRFLPLAFRMRGMSLGNVSLFKLLMLPWIMKALWAPLVDNYFTKKFWLNVCLIMLTFTCIIAAFTTPDHVTYLALVMLLFNFITSIQDVALDSLIIETLHPSQLAKGNIAQVVGYKTGGLFSGGIFALFTEIISWENIFFTLAIIYVFGFFLSAFFLPEDNGVSGNYSDSEIRFQRQSISGREDLNSMPHDHASVAGNTLYCYFWKIFDTKGTFWMLLFVLFYKIGEQGVLNMFPMFLLDNGISPQTAGFWTGFTGQALSLLGSIAGGLMDYRQLFSYLKGYLLIRGISVAMIWAGISFWTSNNSFIYGCSICALQLVFLTGGAVTTLTYTLVMQLSQKAPPRCRASHYTLLVTGDVLGRLLFSSAMGAVTQWLGYSFVFGLFSIVSLLILVYMSYAPLGVRTY